MPLPSWDELLGRADARRKPVAVARPSLRIVTCRDCRVAA